MVLLAGGYDVAIADLEAIAKQRSIPLTHTVMMAGNVNRFLRKADPLLKHGLEYYRKPSGETAFLLLTQNRHQYVENFQYVESEHDKRIRDRFVHYGNLESPVLPFITILDTWTKQR